MKQSAEWQIGDEYAGQDGVEVPDVSINIGEGRSAEKKPTDRISYKTIARPFRESGHRNAHAFQNKTNHHDTLNQTQGEHILPGQIRDLTRALLPGSKKSAQSP